MAFPIIRVCAIGGALLGLAVAGYAIWVEAQPRPVGVESTMGMSVYLLGLPVSVLGSFALLFVSDAAGSTGVPGGLPGIAVFCLLVLGLNGALWGAVLGGFLALWRAALREGAERSRSRPAV